MGLHIAKWLENCAFVKRSFKLSWFVCGVYWNCFI